MGIIYSENGWIPIDSCLPGKYYDWLLVLSFNDIGGGYYGVPVIAEYRDGGWYVPYHCEEYQKFANVKITHWQPLPEYPSLQSI